MKKINTISYYRIHINSINMSDNGLLTSGGIGFSVKLKPINIVTIYNGLDHNKIEGYNQSRFNSILINLNRKYKIPKTGWEVHVEQTIKPHIGLGSTTQIEAQLVTAICKISLNQLPEYDDFIMNKIGIESGVGLKCFSRNGFHIDFGYWKNKSKYTLLNSSQAVKDSIYLKLPKDWGVLIMIPKEGSSVFGSIEQEFWHRVLPAKESDVHKISFYTLMGIIPSILDKNFSCFLESLRMVTSLGTKPSEIKLNRKYIKNLFHDVRDAFGFCGLSSLGPTCYTFFEKTTNYSKLIDKLKLKYDDFEILTTEIAYD